MGKNIRYSSLKETEDKLRVIVAIIFLVSLFFYLYVVRNVITQIQWNLFCNTKTFLLVPSLGLWGFLEIAGGPGLITSALLFLHFKLWGQKSINKYGKRIYKKESYIRSLVLTMIISFVFISISFISYCRVDKDRIYVREIRTLFLEKEYSWNTVKSVNINYHKNSRGSGYNLQYVLNFDRFSVNIQNAGLTSKHEKLQQGKKEIHSKIKEKDIPVYKNIDKYNDEINEFLNLIDES